MVYLLNFGFELEVEKPGSLVKRLLPGNVDGDRALPRHKLNEAAALVVRIPTQSVGTRSSGFWD